MDGIAYHAFVDGADLPDPREVQAARVGGSARDLVDALLAADLPRVRLSLERDPALATLVVAGHALAEIAVATGDATLLREVLSHGVPADGTGDGAPLILALHARAPDLAYVLLAEGGAAPAPAAAPLEPVRAAIALSSEGGVRLLLDHGLDANVRDELARTPLHVALDMEQFALAELLIDRGADPHAIDQAGANLATSLAAPMVTDSPAEAAARARLTARLPALGWPDPAPAPAALVSLSAEGRWPPR